MDVLSDILTTLRLRGTVYFQADFRAPWGMDIKGGAMANFHLVVHGSCWLRGPGQQGLQELHQGDLVVVSHGDRHALLHSPDSAALPAESVIGVENESGPRPIYGGRGTATTLICGHYEYDRAGMHPLLRALPALIHLRREQQTEWIATASQLTVLESNSTEDGCGAVVDRLAEVLLIQVIRAYAAKLTDQKGFLAALAEPTVAAALSLLHEEPARSWQLADLASACGVSRTIIVERFKQTLGVAPIQYLTEWRMHKAREYLMTSDASVAQVAERVGYASEWSFSKAFNRVFGEGPGAARRTQSA